MRNQFIWISFLFFLSVLFLFTPSTFATTFDLIPPSGTFQRGQDISFTININTEGSSISSIQSGLTYDTTLLRYVTATAGATMNSIVADTTTYGAGKILFTGTNNTGYNGTGIFATVIFNIIAQSPGSTEICTLWTPSSSPTPTPAPALSCNATCSTNSQCPSDMPCYIVAGQTSGYCRRAACPTVTSCVCPIASTPTALPQTGTEDSRNTAILFAVSFLVAAAGVFYLSSKQKYTLPNTEKKQVTKSRSKKN